MKNRQWLWLTAISLLAGCSGGDGNTPTEVDPNVCTPRCGWGYQCIEGQCIENSKVCDPACTAGFECVDNTCVESKLICHEPCADDTTCVAGECIPNTRICNLSKCDETGQNCTQEQIACNEDELCINDACIKATEYCDPACDSDTQQCVNNQCVFVEPYCDGKAENRCNEDLTRACSTETTPAQWVSAKSIRPVRTANAFSKQILNAIPPNALTTRRPAIRAKEWPAMPLLSSAKTTNALSFRQRHAHRKPAFPMRNNSSATTRPNRKNVRTASVVRTANALQPSLNLRSKSGISAKETAIAVQESALKKSKLV